MLKIESFMNNKNWKTIKFGILMFFIFFALSLFLIQPWNFKEYTYSLRFSNTSNLVKDEKIFRNFFDKLDLLSPLKTKKIDIIFPAPKELEVKITAIGVLNDEISLLNRIKYFFEDFSSKKKTPFINSKKDLKSFDEIEALLTISVMPQIRNILEVLESSHIENSKSLKKRLIFAKLDRKISLIENFVDFYSLENSPEISRNLNLLQEARSIKIEEDTYFSDFLIWGNLEIERRGGVFIMNRDFQKELFKVVFLSIGGLSFSLALMSIFRNFKMLKN